MKKQLSRQSHYRRWLIMAPLGLSIIGFGVCLVAEAAMAKYAGEPWFWAGTIALVVLNSGVCVVGTAVIHRVHFESSKD